MMLDGTPDYNDGVLFVEVSSAKRLGSHLPVTKFMFAPLL